MTDDCNSPYETYSSFSVSLFFNLHTLMYHLKKRGKDVKVFIGDDHAILQKVKPLENLVFSRGFWQREGFVLDFCSTFRILSYVTFRKNLRSPFQNNTPCCFVHCVRIPFIFSRKSKKAPSNEDASRFLAERAGFEPACDC